MTLRRRFESLNERLGVAQHKCGETYNAWMKACREFELVARERDEVWDQLVAHQIDQKLPPSEG